MPAPRWSGHMTDAAAAVPLWVNLFGPCTRIGGAPGLATYLPDLTDRAEAKRYGGCRPTAGRNPSKAW